MTKKGRELRAANFSPRNSYIPTKTEKKKKNRILTLHHSLPPTPPTFPQLSILLSISPSLCYYTVNPFSASGHTSNAFHSLPHSIHLLSSLPPSAPHSPHLLGSVLRGGHVEAGGSLRKAGAVTCPGCEIVLGGQRIVETHHQETRLDQSQDALVVRF